MARFEDDLERFSYIMGATSGIRRANTLSVPEGHRAPYKRGPLRRACQGDSVTSR
jgi:hypothetical protein